MTIQSTEKIQQTSPSSAPELIDTVGKPQVTPLRARDAESPVEKPRILEEVVIEEVSIDGMCGVY